MSLYSYEYNVCPMALMRSHMLSSLMRPAPTARSALIVEESPKALGMRPEFEDASEPTSRRTRIWEFSVTLHCSIIGTCLTTAELRHVVEKAERSIGEQGFIGISVGRAELILRCLCRRSGHLAAPC
jgi:hypothetical protein